MNNFIILTTFKDEKILINIEKIVCIGQVKNRSIVYIDEFIDYSVKESINDILKLLSEKISK